MIDINGADQWDANGVRNQRDANGLRQGYWEICWVNNIACCKGNFLNNKRHGYWEEYYSELTLRAKGHYINNNRKGLWIEYSMIFDKTTYAYYL